MTRRKPLISNIDAADLRFFADKAERAWQNRQLASLELSILEEKSGVRALREKVYHYELEERKALLSMKRVIRKLVPETSDHD